MSRPPKACNTPGCPGFVGRGEGHTSECRARRRRPDHRPSSHARGYDRRWRRTRGAYLYRNPWCSHDGCEEKATDVDHIDGLGPTGPLGHTWSNLRGFCHAHHSQRTARDQPGGWNRDR